MQPCNPSDGFCQRGCEDWYIPDRCDVYLGKGSPHHTYAFIYLFFALFSTLDALVTTEISLDQIYSPDMKTTFLLIHVCNYLN